MPGLFTSSEPLGSPETGSFLGDRGFHLWVMGWIAYRDDHMTPRRTTFCRDYIPGQPRAPEYGHFVAVDNPDYESEE